MAHEHTELELGPGVTALTGPNNSGKSAVVEGLRYLTTNPAPSNCIRHGAKEARVTVELEDGTRVAWIRTRRYPLYEITRPGADEPEEPIGKMGRGVVPEEVRDLLRLDFLEIEAAKNERVDIHIGNQREPVFLINKPGSHAAAFFAASTESAHLLAMQDRLKLRTRDAKRRERDLEADVARIEVALDEFASLPAIAVVVEAARELEGRATRLQRDIPALENVVRAERELRRSLARKTATATVLKGAADPPEIQDVKGLHATLARFHQLETGRKRAASAVRALQPLKPLPEVAETRRLSELCKQLQEVDFGLKSARIRASATASLQEPPTPSYTDHLSRTIDDLLAMRTRVARLDRSSAVLRTVAEPPRVEPDGALRALLADIRRVAENRGRAEAGLRAVEAELQTLEDRMEKRIRELGCCPTCGAEMTTATFLDRRCRHDG